MMGHPEPATSASQHPLDRLVVPTCSPTPTQTHTSLHPPGAGAAFSIPAMTPRALSRGSKVLKILRDCRAIGANQDGFGH